MFVDHAKIYVKGGDGGNGVVAFRREKYVPLGGPSGGDGGRGGNVIFIADEGMRTLIDFRYKKHFKAGRGVHGQGKNMHGAWGSDLIVKVPVGTIIIDDDDASIIADLFHPGQEAIIARGGRGGRGNARFVSAARKAPSIAENGEPGEEHWVRLELKLLADVGLVGFPNAGKSTLISRISAARPKIADYPFTTLEPNLGVVMTRNKESFVVADIPGLIKGAHQGAGLGHDFLRHIERTRVLVFVLDAAQTDGRDVEEDFQTLRYELAMYNERLAHRPYIIAANKMDVPEARERYEQLREDHGEIVFPISGVEGRGISELIEKMHQMIKEIPEEEVTQAERVIHRFKEEEDFKIDVVEGVYQVSGSRIEKLVVMTRFDQEDALRRFQHIMRQMGVEKALKEQGARNGDTVRIMDLEFDYSE